MNGKYPNPEVKARVRRRRFSAEYKRRILAEADQCQYGELGALLRREGLDSIGNNRIVSIRRYSPIFG